MFSFEASNDFLKERIINLPQEKVFGTHNTENGEVHVHFKLRYLCIQLPLAFLRRLKLFRELNEEDVTVLNYFDEFEIHPIIISEW